MNEQQVMTLVSKDVWMMEVLKAARSLQLPDWWVCAGFVRSKIWDVLHGFNERTKTPDVDVIYYDPDEINEEYEKVLEEKLFALMPDVPWSVKNEARMHLVNSIEPYSSASDAISKFPETATALGVKLDNDGNVVLTAPHGLDDVLSCIVRPTPYFVGSTERMQLYDKRVAAKNWSAVWNMVRIY
jgi:hypothetical protein